MLEIHGPYYTLAETCEIMAIRESELIHAIEKDEISPVVHTKSRRMLVLSRDIKSLTSVYGTCTYRGALALHPESIKRLLDDGNFRLGTGYGATLEESGVSEWTSTYPFKRPPPHDPEIIWQPRERHQMPAKGFGVTPLPVEAQPITNTLYGTLAKIAEASPLMAETMKEQPGLQGISLPGVNTLRLDFHTNSVFSRDDLRIPASEIKKFQTAQTKQVFALQSVDGRDNQLHALIDRVLADHPTAKAKNIWKLIEADFNSDACIYDKDGIIQAMDANCIEWQSRHGNSNVLKWSSFSVLLSRRKTKLSS